MPHISSPEMSSMPIAVSKTPSSVPPTEEEVARARAYAAGRRVLAFENTNAVARTAANQSIVFGEEDIDPDRIVERLDAVTFDEVAEIARRVDPATLAVACVGPHEEAELAV